WTLSLQDGSPPVASLAESTGYAAATVKARLGGQGQGRTIAFAISHLGTGQTVAFQERGAFGTRSVGVVRRARGTLHFTAAGAPASAPPDPPGSLRRVSSTPPERLHATRSRANPGGMDVLQVLGSDVRPLRERKPPWFKVPAPGGPKYRELTELIRSENLHTV